MARAEFSWRWLDRRGEDGIHVWVVAGDTAVAENRGRLKQFDVDQYWFGLWKKYSQMLSVRRRGHGQG